jgi:hypothetical protein
MAQNDRWQYLYPSRVSRLRGFLGILWAAIDQAWP